jgi:hypothetical protein
MTAKSWIFQGNGLAKKPGWFSWRHKDRDAHDEAREAYLAERGPAARRRRAVQRRLNEQGASELLTDIFADPQ